MRKFVFLLLLIGAFGYARALAIDTAWFRHVPSAHHLTYWFDNNSATAQELPLSQTSLQMDVSFLPLGVHTIHFYAVDSAGVVYPTSSAMFFCPPSVGSDSTAAQQVVYWFDQDFDNRHVSSLHSGPQLIDVSTLAMGVHTLHSYVVGIDNTVYPTSSAMFFCPPSIGSDSTAAQQVVYWFDQDFDGRHFASLQSGPQLLDVSDLDIGVHTIHSYVVGIDNTVYPTTSVMFFRMPYIDTDSAEAQELVYWFDQDYANRHIAPLQAGVQMLDVSDLDIGVHTIHSYVVGADNKAYPTTSVMFFRLPYIDSDSAEAQEVVYWFDQDYANRQHTTMLSMTQMMDVSALSIGVHTLHSYVLGADGTVYPTTSSMFFRPPGAGSESMDGITQYYYWFNNDITNATRVHVNPVTNPMQWYGLIPIDSIPFRSSYFHFEIDTAQQPHAYAKNTFHTLFMDDLGKFVMGDAAPFVDYHVSQPVVADTIERGATKTITVPTNNNIHWFKLGVGVGDSLSFTTNKRCTIQLYAPNGEMVFRSSGDSVLSWVGCHAWEDGVYYLAVHDAEGTGNMTVSYQWVYRYAVLAWDVHRVGNGGISTITFEGNGFDNLDTVYLVKGLDTIPAYALHHERNTAIEIRFDFLGTDTGIYDALFIFSESGIYKMNVVEVDNAVPIYLTSNVSYPSTFLRGGSVMYSFEITNMGNMTAYNVPVYFYIGMPINGGISWAKFSGVNLVDYYDLMKDLYDWTDEERENLKQYSEEVGDLHYFVQSTGLDDRLDGINILSANFFLNIPPDSTRTITLELKSNNYVDVWMSSPDNWKADTRSEDRSPTNRFDNRPLMANRSDFCCWHDDLEDIANNISVTLAVFSFGTQAVAAVTLGAAAVTALTPLWPLAGAISAEAAQIEALSLAAGITSCMMGGIANISAEIAASLCNDHISGRERFVSWGGLAIGCVSNFLPTKPIFKGPTVLQTIATGTSATTSIVSEAYNSRNPECTDNPPKGGKSQPYVPVDPNEIVGYIAESGSTYIPDSVQTVDYFIECENDPVMAQAAAHKVVIVDTLSSQLFDLSTFRPSQVTIGNNSIFLDGAQNGVYTMDLRPNINALAQVSINYTPTTGVAIWTIEALNPITLTPTLDVNEGVLPPNTDGSGIARVYYSIGLLNTLGDGAPVSNRAYITFDFEDAIATPVWTNIIDAISPTSRIVYGDMEDDTLSLSFQAADNRSGVWRYDVFGRSDSLDSWHLVNTGKTSVQRLAVDSLLTDFYVVAIDSAGNRENKTPQVEYNTTRGVVGPSVTTYQIQFVNFDNTVLSSYRLPMGATPAYLGSTPSRNADAHYSYRFRGWTPAIAPVAGNAVYHAVYDSIPNSYRICFFDYDSTLLQSDSLPYGAMPSYYSSIPSRPEVDSFVYAFVGWTPELMPVSGNADYRPVFDSMLYYQLPRYLVTFRNWNDSVLQSDSVTFGTMPHYWGMEPTREGNAYCDYRFRGWTPRLAPVTESIVYTAEFDTLVHSYPVTFVNFNGAVLQQDTLPYGSMPVYRGNTPARRTTIQYTYTFVGWSPNIDTVRGAAVYTAVFDSVFSCISQYHYDNISTCDSVLWRGNEYATSGTYSERVEGVAYGCDSVYVLNLVVNSKSYTTDVQTSCNSYSWHGTTYTTSTNTPTFTEQNMAGCDSVVTLHLTINHSNTGTEEQTACDSYTWHNTTYTASTNTPTFTEQNVEGCDSVVTLHLTINHSNTGTDVQTACDSYTWHGTTYTASTNTPTFTEQNMAGCDSVVTLHLTINHSNTGTDEQTACDTYTWHGTTYTASTNTPTFTEQNVEGCDSVVTLHLTINHSNTGTDVQTACDSYTWHGTTYTASTNTPTFTEQNVEGCDSVVTLHLTVNHSNTGTDVQTACDTYTWHGTTYTASTNTPTFIEQNVEGCDSVVTLHLTINHSNTGTDEQIACDFYTWHGTTYTASTNTPTYTGQNVEGCDSVVTLHLTINHSNTGTDVQTACDSYTWHGTTYTASTNTPTFTEQNVEGCDSVVTLHLTINHSNTGTEEQTACDSYTWHNTTYTASTNTSTFTEQNMAGCDSVVTLHLTINHSNTGTDVQTACDSYTWHGTTYTASTNTPTFTEQNMAGCDSVVTLHLTINHSNTGTDVQTACDSYTWHGTTYTASTNTPTFIEQNADGCDSVVTLHLTINHSNTGTDVQTACDSYTWHGTTYTASTNTPTFTEQNADGCDSVVTLHLTINHSNTGTEEQTACDSYTWHNTTYTASTNTSTFTEQNMAGCDSVVTLHLTINHSNTGTDVQTACDSYTWHGTTYTASTNTPTFTGQNVEGCDSVVTLHLTINHSNTGTDVQTACDSYTWHGTTYTTSTNTPTFTEQNVEGCDSVVTLHLTINHSNTGTDVQTACDSYTWHGTTYTASTNTPTFTEQNADGCDSVVTLHLTINNSTSSEFDLADCDSVTWSDWTFYASTDTTIVLTNSVGCDSLNMLHLIVNYTVQTTIVDSAQGSYDWNGQTYTESGEYTFTTQTEAGCDSIVTLILTITQTEGILFDGFEQVTLYPNPTTGKVVVNGMKVICLEVYDLDGRLVGTFMNTNSFDISQLSSGTYLVRITMPQGETIRRVIKH